LAVCVSLRGLERGDQDHDEEEGETDRGPAQAAEVELRLLPAQADRRAATTAPPFHNPNFAILNPNSEIRNC
jgi:hypothetical protein